MSTAVDRNHFRTLAQPTPFHARAAEANKSGEWQRWAGYITADRYTEVELEYFAVRNTTTLFDLSPMIKYRIAGADAVRYVDRLVSRSMDKIVPGRVAYAVWCDDRGKVLDDGTVFRTGEREYRICCQDRQLPWLLDSAIGFDVSVEDVTEDIAALALQGPTSCAVLQELALEGIEMLRPFHMSSFGFEGGRLEVSRTGYTGDLGYELWVAPELSGKLWDRLMEAGRLHGIRPMGSRALDLVRIEAGFLLPHVDFMPAEAALRPTRGRSPFELGMNWLVDFGKGHFIGRRALLEESRRGSYYRVVGLDIEGNRPAHTSFIYHDRNREAGHVTSAMWSPTCKRNLAIATLKSQYLMSGDDNLWAEIYVHKELKWEKRMVRATVVERPFFNPPRRRAVPAGRV